MKINLLIVALLFVCQNLFAQTCTSIKNGSWNDPLTWSCGVVPSSGYSNIIVAHEVRVPNGGSTGNGSLTIRSGGNLELIGQLNLGTNDISCNNTLPVESGGIVTAESNGQNERLRLCDAVVLTGQQNPNGQGITIPAGGYWGPATFSRNGPAPQPVEILFFEGAVKNESVNLKWATSYEDSFDFFTIERSADAIHFEAIGTLNGSGYITSIVHYQYNDHMPLTGRAYYRLKATDFDGSVEYHSIITLVKDGAGRVAVYPNPLSGNQFKILVSVQPQENSRIRIYSIVGKEVYQSHINGMTNEYTLNKNLDPGLYIVVVESGSTKFQTKLTVR